VLRGLANRAAPRNSLADLIEDADGENQSVSPAVLVLVMLISNLATNAPSGTGESHHAAAESEDTGILPAIP